MDVLVGCQFSDKKTVNSFFLSLLPMTTFLTGIYLLPKTLELKA